MGNTIELKKIENILNQNYNYNVFKTIGSYMEFDKTYMIFIYWKTNKELEMITESIKLKIREIIIEYFSKNNYYPNEVKDIIIYLTTGNLPLKYFDIIESALKVVFMETLESLQSSVIEKKHHICENELYELLGYISHCRINGIGQSLVYLIEKFYKK